MFGGEYRLYGGRNLLQKILINNNGSKETIPVCRNRRDSSPYVKNQWPFREEEIWKEAMIMGSENRELGMGKCIKGTFPIRRF